MVDGLDYKKALTGAQYKIVQHREGPALVIAGPGSGKTHTMTYRVAYLIEHGVKPWQILLLTFTKKAAREMLGRVEGLAGDAAQKVQGGTFHSFAARTLFKHYDRLGYTDQITILGQGDAVELVGTFRQEAAKALGKGVKLPVSAKFLSLFSRAVNKQVNIQDILPEFPDFDECQSVAIEMFFAYQAAKREMNLLDYDDLLTDLRRLLQENPGLRKLYGTKYQYIIIDEYQDTNIIQADIALALASIHQNLVVVGDDCQSIYEFRGANIRNILTFTEAFPEAVVYQLTENFRSYPPIVEVANALIGKAEEKLDKVLIAVSQETSIHPKVFSFDSQMGQAEWVVGEIQRYRRSGVPLEEIAVLYRNGYHANLLDVFLTARNIPYVKIGGVKLTESMHVKDLLSFLKVRVNPKDKLSWKRVLTMVPGVGAKTAHKTIEYLEQASADGTDMAAALAELSGKQKYKGPLREVGDFLLTLEMGPERVHDSRIQRTDGQPIHSPVRELLEAVWEHYQPIFEEKFDLGEYEYRKFGIEHLLTYADGFSSPSTFLAEFDLSEEQEKGTDKKNVLTLSTIHSAKGCEWRVVFIIECIEGALPSYRAENIEEELRLLYVATTRAKHHLTITYPQTIMMRGDWEETEPSRFLAGLPYVGVD